MKKGTDSGQGEKMPWRADAHSNSYDACERRPKPKDLALLHWFLLYRNPVTDDLTDESLERAREHCRMSSQRLQELQHPEYQHHWERMHSRRQRRKDHFLKHGCIRDGWSPSGPGEQDRSVQIAAMKRYRQSLAPKRAIGRKSREGKDTRFTDWIEEKYLRSRRISDPSKRLRELDAIEAYIWERQLADKLTLEEFEVLEEMKMANRQSMRMRRSAVRKTRQASDEYL